MRDEVLLQAIDNTEDVLLHGGKWSEEAKERVHQARRAGRRVSEMFGDTVKKTASKIDTKYNISLNNEGTRKLYKQETKNANNAQTSWKKLSATKAGKRRDNSVASRIAQAITGQSRTKWADKQFKKNIDAYNKSVSKYLKKKSLTSALSSARSI